MCMVRRAWIEESLTYFAPHSDGSMLSLGAGAGRSSPLVSASWRNALSGIVVGAGLVCDGDVGAGDGGSALGLWLVLGPGGVPWLDLSTHCAPTAVAPTTTARTAQPVASRILARRSARPRSASEVVRRTVSASWARAAYARSRSFIVVPLWPVARRWYAQRRGEPGSTPRQTRLHRPDRHPRFLRYLGDRQVEQVVQGERLPLRHRQPA